MRISLGMIVLNGEPFIEYSLRQMYDHVDEIIVVEGAVEKAMFATNADGSSTDRTVEIVRNLPDPDGKIQLIQGRWKGKLEQSQEYMKRATGDYVWAVDSDEMYLPDDVARIKQMLEDDPEITVVSFYERAFWHSFRTQLVGPPWEGCREGVFYRLFKRVPGAHYTTHRPPTVAGDDDVNLVEKKLVRANEMRRRGIFLFHYSYVDTGQIRQKVEYYRRLGSKNAGTADWFEKVWLAWPGDPAGVEAKYGTHPIGTGWTQPYDGPHPPVMYDHPLMQKELAAAAR